MSRVFCPLCTEMMEKALCSFSTTSALDLTVSSIMLMEATKEFFSFGLSTTCGIAYIDLQGTRADWEQLQAKARYWLDLLELQEWKQVLDPVLDQFVAAFDGHVRTGFWDSAYKWINPGSGDAYVHGWLHVFFPFLADGKPNYYHNTLRRGVLMQMINEQGGEVCRTGKQSNPWEMKEPVRAPGTDDFPRNLASVPLTWTYFGKPIELDMIGGVMLVQVQGDALAPRNGWVVARKLRDPQELIAEDERKLEELLQRIVTDMEARASRTVA